MGNTGLFNAEGKALSIADVSRLLLLFDQMIKEENEHLVRLDFTISIIGKLTLITSIV